MVDGVRGVRLDLKWSMADLFISSFFRFRSACNRQ
jgi:hypothetical protein